METVCHNQFLFESLFSKEVIADFAGGRITSDAGGLLLRELDQRYRLAKNAARCLHDPRDANGEHRSALQQKLKDVGIPTAIYYPRPLHLQTALAGLGYRAGDFPVSEDYATRIFSLPMHPYLQAAEQEEIAAILCQV